MEHWSLGAPFLLASALMVVAAGVFLAARRTLLGESA